MAKPILLSVLLLYFSFSFLCFVFLLCISALCFCSHFSSCFCFVFSSGFFSVSSSPLSSLFFSSVLVFLARSSVFFFPPPLLVLSLLVRALCFSLCSSVRRGRGEGGATGDKANTRALAGQCCSLFLSRLLLQSSPGFLCVLPWLLSLVFL